MARRTVDAAEVSRKIRARMEEVNDTEAHLREDELFRHLCCGGDVWLLKNDVGYAACARDEANGALVPLWPTRRQAQQCASELFDGYDAERMSQEMLDGFLGELARRGLWIGMNPDERLVGIDLPADELVRRLEQFSDE